MSEHENPSSIAARHAPTIRARKSVARFFLRAAQRWQRKQAVAVLRNLDDSQLEDIGIARNDIPRVVEGLLKEPEKVPTAAPPAGSVATVGIRMREAA